MVRYAGWMVVPATLAVLVLGCFPFFQSLPTDPNGVSVDPNTSSSDVRTLVYKMGEFKGVLADELHDYLNLPAYDPNKPMAPIAIAGDAVAGLTAEEIAGVRNTYQSHHPIILVYPTLAEILDFQHRVLGNADFQYELPDGEDHLEIYAVDKEPDGSDWQAGWIPPADEATRHTQTLTLNREDGTTTTTTTDPVDVNYPEDEDACQNSRAAMLLEWLEDDATRMETSIGAASKQKLSSQMATVSESGQSLTDLAKAFVDQAFWQQKGNNYTVSTFVYSCHSTNNDLDWLYVQQYAVLNGSGAYTTNESMKKGYFISVFETSSSLAGFADNSAAVGLIQSSPQTANNTTTVESEVGFNIGGQVSFGKDSGAGLSAGMTIANHTTVTIQDCKVLNKSMDRVNNAHWRYEMKMPQVGAITDCFFQNCITNPPDLSITTFQPMNQWIWKCTSDVRAAKAPIDTWFGCYVSLAEEGWYFFYADVNYTHDWASASRRIYFPYPPTAP